MTSPPPPHFQPFLSELLNCLLTPTAHHTTCYRQSSQQQTDCCHPVQLYTLQCTLYCTHCIAPCTDHCAIHTLLLSVLIIVLFFQEKPSHFHHYQIPTSKLPPTFKERSLPLKLKLSFGPKAVI